MSKSDRLDAKPFISLSGRKAAQLARQHTMFTISNCQLHHCWVNTATLYTVLSPHDNPGNCLEFKNILKYSSSVDMTSITQYYIIMN